MGKLGNPDEGGSGFRAADANKPQPPPGGRLYDPVTGYWYSEDVYEQKAATYNTGVIVNPPSFLHRYGPDAGWPVLVEMPDVTLVDEERGLRAAESEAAVYKLLTWRRAMRGALYALASLYEPELNLDFMSAESDAQVLGTYNDLIMKNDLKYTMPVGVFALAIVELTEASKIPEPIPGGPDNRGFRSALSSRWQKDPELHSSAHIRNSRMHVLGDSGMNIYRPRRGS